MKTKVSFLSILVIASSFFTGLNYAEASDVSQCSAVFAETEIRIVQSKPEKTVAITGERALHMFEFLAELTGAVEDEIQIDTVQFTRSFNGLTAYGGSNGSAQAEFVTQGRTIRKASRVVSEVAQIFYPGIGGDAALSEQGVYVPRITCSRGTCLMSIALSGGAL